MDNPTKHIHITVVGDGDTGKTCMLIVYKDKKYEEYYIPTVFDSYSMTVPINDMNYTVILQDTAGQEGYDKLRPLVYPQTDVFIICFSVGNWNSYHNVVHRWNPEVRHFRPTAKIILVATKCDLRQEVADSIKHEDGDTLRKIIKADRYIECSSKFIWNVDTVFQQALESLFSKSNNSYKRKSCTLL